MNDELLDDLERVINSLESFLLEYEMNNDTAEGRMLFFIRWLKQNIEENILQLPLKYSEISTLTYVYSEGNLDYIDPSIKSLLKRLINILHRGGNIKKHHYPKLINHIDIYLNKIEPYCKEKGSIEEKLYNAWAEIKNSLENNQIELPLVMSDRPDIFASASELFEKFGEDIASELSNASDAIEGMAFDGITPEYYADELSTPESE